ncbi:MAG: protein tyrosine phosphatase [Planctomycetota bacterium]
MSDTENLLFVCTANQQRSPTAESLFDGDDRYEARSCGTLAGGKRECSEEMIQWADVIFCMEDRHKHTLLNRFPEMENKKIVVLAIPDCFYRGDPELIHLLEDRLARWLT